jgi:DNA sulfur modification protein DndB
MQGSATHAPLSLASIRGTMGNWVYYSAVMPISELAKRVSYAEEIHTNRGLSEMIQRKLSGKRAEEISRYLADRPDRFFNSLVIAFYGGPPTWFSGSINISALKSAGESFDVEDIRECGVEMGVLQFKGTERLFALDGQHRLSGIKSALKSNKLPLGDCVPVIFVAHSNTADGIRRSREIFTTLNKEAKKVGVGDIIALDENDPAAIVTRMLVEGDSGLCGEKVAYKQTESINPAVDVKCVTTIANIYFSLLNIFRAFKYPSKSIKQIAALPRPDDSDIATLLDLAQKYFGAIGVNFPSFGEAMSDRQSIVNVIAQNRHSNGGHLLFRPVGITILTNIVSRIKATSPDLGIEKCVEQASSIPVELQQPPYRDVLWETKTSRMRPKGKQAIIQILSHRLNLPISRGSYEKTKLEYAELTGTTLNE